MIPRPADPRWHALTALGLGHRRPAPGTWGSLPPVAIAGAMIALGLGPAEHPVLYHAVIVSLGVVATAACVVYGDWAEAWYGKKDPGWVVADEVAGQCVALLALPVAAADGAWPVLLSLLIAFLAFRIFDILKPPPASLLQRIPSGWGIVLDDLFAGVYALLATQIVLRLLL